MRQDAAGHGRTRRPMAIGHWPLARLSARQHFSNYIRVRATLQRQLHAGGSRNVGVCPGPSCATAPHTHTPPCPLQFQAAWYPWHPQHPRQCHVKRQRAQPNVGLADGQTDAYNSDGRQATLTLPVTLTLTSALSLTGVTRLPPHSVPPLVACHGQFAFAKYATGEYLAQSYCFLIFVFCFELIYNYFILVYVIAPI